MPATWSSPCLASSAAHLVDALARRRRRPASRETAYGSWMVANLTLRDRPASRGFPLAWDNVLYDSPSLGYVVATHQSGRDHGPTVFTYYLPLLDDDPRRAPRALAAHALGRMGGDDPGRPRPRPPRAPRPGRARRRVPLGPRDGAAAARLPVAEALAAASRPLGRIHFAHTDLSGMALFEEAQYWGIRAAEAILRERGHSFRSWLA